MSVEEFEENVELQEMINDVDEVIEIGEKGDKTSILLVITIVLVLAASIALFWVGFGLGEKVSGWLDGGANVKQVVENGNAAGNDAV